MFAIVLIALSLSLFVVFLVFVLTFLDVAFAGPRPDSDRRQPDQSWHPPLIQGNELFAWAAEAARSSVRRRLSHGRSASTAAEIARDVFAGTNYAIDRAPRTLQRGSPHDCSSCRHQMIAVTPPEVLAIAESLRKRSPGEVSRIRDRARENAKRTKGMDREQYEGAQVVCPLLLGENRCAANGTRPIQCKAWYRSADEGGKESRRQGDTFPLDAHAHTVGQGAEDGLASELQAEGLDGNQYELNSALAVALDKPDAAVRWSNAEPVFEGCRKYN